MSTTPDTIAAISTPFGMGGIGIVRLSGSRSVGILSRIFRFNSQKVGDNYQSHRIYYGHVVNPETEETVDEALVSVMLAPKTYTREDVVEINCHGGPAAVRKVLELAVKNGARLAEPGEFTRRAFLNGRIDLTQAEAVMDIIAARTEQSLMAAERQLSGVLKEKIEAVKEKLVELLALTEVSIDFVEDVDGVPTGELLEGGREIRSALAALIETYEQGRVLRDGLNVAIVGRPNVGKSSLLNMLAGSERAIVTEFPGTTRDTVEELINVAGVPVRVIDTAGIRHSDDKIERLGIERSLRALEGADLALLVLDGSEPLVPEDAATIEKINKNKHIVVINKSDLPQKIGGAAVFSEAADVERKTKGSRSFGVLANEPPAKENSAAPLPAAPVFVSCKTGAGLEELCLRIRDAAMLGGRERPPEAAINLRHKVSLEKAVTALARFEKGCLDGLSQEFLAVELNDALDAVGEVVGATTPEDILNRIFSQFCIGK